MNWVYESECEAADQQLTMSGSILLFHYLSALRGCGGKELKRKLAAAVYDWAPELPALPKLDDDLIWNLHFGFPDDNGSRRYRNSVLTKAVTKFVNKTDRRNRQYAGDYTMCGLERTAYEETAGQKLADYFTHSNRIVMFPDCDRADYRYPKVPIGPFSPDIVLIGIRSRSLIIEVDGDTHNEKVMKDDLAERFYRYMGFEVYRVHNDWIEWMSKRFICDINEFIFDARSCLPPPRIDRHLQKPQTIGRLVDRIYLLNIAYWMTLAEIQDAMQMSGIRNDQIIAFLAGCQV